MTSPALDMSSATAPRLVFYYWDSGGSDDVVVKVSTDGSTFTTVYTTPTTVSSWTETIVDLTSYAGNSAVYVQFEGTSVWGVNNPHVDNVVVEETPQTPAVSMFYTEVSWSSITTGDTATTSNFPVLTNTGGATLNLTSVDFSGSSELSISTTQTTVAAGGTLYVDLTYMPTDMGRDGGTITVTSDASDSPHSMSYRGTAGRYQEGWEGSTANYGAPPSTYPYDWTTYDVDGSGYSFYTYGNYGSSYGSSGNWHVRNRWAFPADDWLITPELEVVAGDSLIFYARNYSSYNEQMSVRISTTGTDIADFTTLLDSTTVSGNVPTLYAYDLSSYAGGHAWVAIRSTANNMYYLQIDEMYLPDVFVDPSPNLQALTAGVDFGGTVFSGATETFSVINVGQDDLTITDVSFSDSAFATTTAALTVAGGDTGGIDVTFTPTAEQNYAGYMVITSNSGSSPDSFAVSGFGVDAMFYQGFEGPWPPTGWTDATTANYGWDQNIYGGAHSGSYWAYCNLAGSELVTPSLTIPATSGYRLKFWYRNELSTQLQSMDVIVGSDTLLQIVDNATNIYQEGTLSLEAYSGQTIQVSFVGQTGTGNWAYGICLDDVVVEELPNTHVSGLATDSETGTALASVAVNINGNIVYTDAAGAYALFGFTPGSFDLGFSKDGYNDASFYVEVALGDSIVQNVALAPETLSDLYATGFEVGDDLGSTQIVSGYDFAVLDTMFNADGDTILADAGVYMLAYPDTAGVNYNNNDLVFWISDSVVDISSTASLQMTLDANYDTESGWDYFYVGLLLDDGYIYYGIGQELSGSSNGWVELSLDVSWALSLSTTATPVIWFASDGSVNSYWGGAFDNLMLSGNAFFLAPPTNLVAENYGSSIPLSWDEPSSTGRLSYDLHRAELANIHNLSRPMVTDENGQTVELLKGPRDYEALTVEYQYSTAASRSFSHYNILRWDWPFGIVELHDTSQTNSYEDVDVSDGDYVNYFVTAVYDEGTSVASNEAQSRAGLPLVFTDDAFGGEDFEDGFAFENWEQFNSTTAAQWVVGDSAAADSAFGVGAGYPAPSHTNFAYISDGRGGGADFQSFLISPFLDFVDNHTAILNVAAYAQVYASSAYTPCYIWVRADMGPWYPVIDFSFDHTSGWGDYSASISDIVGGSDYAQIAVVYGHLGGWNSGYGNGIAVDDLNLEIIPGPHSLTLTPSLYDVGLSWTHPDSTMNLLSDPVDITADRQITAVATDEDLLDLSDDRTDCFSQGDPNSGWITGFYGPDSGGLTPPTFAALHTFNLGPMVLDEVVIHGYYNTDDTTTARADVFVGVADLNGTTTDTIATGISFFDISAAGSWALASFDLTGLTYNATDSTYLKVTWTPLDTGYIALFGAHMWIPGQKISDPAIDPGLNGLSGYDDSSGVYTPATRSWVIEICGTPTPPAISYNVYKNGVLTIDGLEETTWVDENASVVTEACYWVNGVVPMSFDMGLFGAVVDGPSETEFTNVECATAINQPPSSFALLTPGDGDTIMITQDNIGSSQLFAWNASSDPNGTPVEYEICTSILAPFDQWCNDIGGGTSNFVPLANMADYIDSLMQAGLSNGTIDITWTVYASDGLAETEASNGPRALHIDAGHALGIHDDLLPDVFALHQNHPNPFNPVTTIRFDVPQESLVRMDVYNILGQRVRTLVNGTMQPGFHAIRWNGTNDTGKPLASGMYIYRIYSTQFTAVKKLVLMK
ncbi:MAG: choice-of-anchor J domain-containing protein [Candidatus Marinimicrobia bacterium]|nr:choice-of-anchor J domain-containing protein [Candidatus Neomarinimicrobiota bacterium]